jgi:hypothetical protein
VTPLPRIIPIVPGEMISTMPITIKYPATRKNKAAITLTLAGRSIPRIIK